MKAHYDSIGSQYAVKRQTDPIIAQELHKELEGASRILNIGAGTGSYEPPGVELIAIEPSQRMIEQRPANAHPVVQGAAESLPFEDKRFSHTMTILSMHHWEDRSRAFQEIKRVTREKFLALTWNPDSEPFWLTRDYFPEIIEADRKIFPGHDEISRSFRNVEIRPMPIPEHCVDGFLAAYWKRPEAYLDEAVRRSISTFSKLQNVDKGLNRLRTDLDSGKWHQRNQDILHLSSLDTGYVLITGEMDGENMSKERHPSL